MMKHTHYISFLIAITIVWLTSRKCSGSVRTRNGEARRKTIEGRPNSGLLHYELGGQCGPVHLVQHGLGKGWCNGNQTSSGFHECAGLQLSNGTISQVKLKQQSPSTLSKME